MRQAVVWLILGCLSSAAFAQVSINGSLRGRISDPSNAALAGAALTLTNAATATAQKVVTDNNGEYLFARVPPGIYTLTAEKDGFKRAQRESIVGAVNENAVADVALSVGAISETVTVEAGAALVQANSVELSGLVNERRVKELPLNGRNFIKLVQLAPGVGNPGSANNPPINGGRAVTNSYVVDGIGSNDERLATGFVGVNGSNTDLGQNVPNLISTEAVQEYRIITSNADATFGRGRAVISPRTTISKARASPSSANNSLRVTGPVKTRSVAAFAWVSAIKTTAPPTRRPQNRGTKSRASSATCANAA